jgi:hypothetical protein
VQSINNQNSFVQQSKNEEIATYYGNMRHLSELIIKEMSFKNAEMKTDSFFKPCPSSSATTSTDPGPPRSLSPCPDL